MNKKLASLILEYGHNMWPYLYLRALIVSEKHSSVRSRKSAGFLGLVLTEKEIEEICGINHLLDFHRMGFVKLTSPTKDFNYYTVNLGTCDDGIKWFIDPEVKTKPSKVIQKSESKSDLMKFLTKGVNLFGQPVDYKFAKSGVNPKYFKLAKTVLSSQTLEEAEKVLEFINDNWNLLTAEYNIPENLELGAILSKGFWRKFSELNRKGIQSNKLSQRFVDDEEESSFSW